MRRTADWRDRRIAVREVTPGAGRWFTNTATLADLDGDGHADLVVANYFPDDARILDARAGGRESMQHSMTRADNGGRKHLLRWKEGAGGSQPFVRYIDIPGALEDAWDQSWTLAIGAADLDGDLLPELYFANDFGPDRLLHNRSQPGEFRFALLEGRKTLTSPSSKVLGRDSYKGMGVDFGDLDGDGVLDIFVSNIADEYALEESHFAFLGTGEPRSRCVAVSPRFPIESERLGLSRSGWGWDAKLADFDNDGVVELVQAVGFLRGTTDRWPELQELAMGNDELLHDPSSWPRFGPGDDLSGHDRNPFAVRHEGRFWDIAPRSRPRRAGGQPRDRGRRRGRRRRPRFRRRQPVGPLVVLSQRGERRGGRVVPRPAPAAAGRSRPARADPIAAGPSRRRPERTAGDRGLGAAVVSTTAGPSKARSTAATATRAVAVSTCISGSDPAARDEPIAVELAWRDPNGRVRRETRRFTPGWHTVLLGHADTTGE